MPAFEIPIELLSSFDFKADPRTREAVERALKDNDIQTVFFVNLINQDKIADGAYLAGTFNTTSYYWSTRTEATLQTGIDQHKVPSDHTLESALVRSSYRPEILMKLFKETPWLTLGGTGANGYGIKVEDDYYKDKVAYKEAVQTVLTSFSHPEGVATRIEVVSNTIAEFVSQTRNLKLTKERNFWVQFASIDKDETDRPVVRAFRLTFAKPEDESSTVDFSYEVVTNLLNKPVFEEYKDKIDSELISLGQRLAQQKTTDVVIPYLTLGLL